MSLEKIEKNTRWVKTLIGLFICLSTVIYSICIFIYKNRECTVRVDNLYQDFIEMKSSSDIKHKMMESKIEQNSRDFQLGLAKLDVGLARISTDIQFIKEQFIKMGMEK